MSIIIDRSKCVGCCGCVECCPNTAIQVIGGFARINDNCVLCGMCIESCPVKAISIRKEAHEKDLRCFRDIWVFVEQQNGRVPDVAYELLGKGRTLADALECKLVAVVFGYRMQNLPSLGEYGADSVICIDHSELETALEIPYAVLLSELIEARKPEIVLFGATTFGRILAPRVAATIKTGLTADCTELEIDLETKLLRQTRPAFGGNLMATIVCPEARPQMATVRPCVMLMPSAKIGRRAEVEQIPYQAGMEARTDVLQILPELSAEKITDAQVLVVAGKGIGSKKNMKTVVRLAELLNGNYGVSRPLVDLGWADYSHQVGQTGSAVSPSILISLGVSGAIQHLVGIGGAKTIVAVNIDKEAPIFQAANYAIVHDCVSFAEELIKLLEQTK